MAAEAPQKPIHSLILDTGPLIKNAVSISTIINSAEEIYTTSAIISEIRDEATRSRVQTSLMPFLKIKNPSPASYEAVVAFSKKTGDFAALSRQDLGILALAYEVHCERNGGSWGLREAPKQPLKTKPGEKEVEEETKEDAKDDEGVKVEEGDIHVETAKVDDDVPCDQDVASNEKVKGEEEIGANEGVQIDNEVSAEGQDAAEQQLPEDDTEGWSQVPTRLKKTKEDRPKKQKGSAKHKQMKQEKEQRKQARALESIPTSLTAAVQQSEAEIAPVQEKPEEQNTVLGGVAIEQTLATQDSHAKQQQDQVAAPASTEAETSQETEAEVNAATEPTPEASQPTATQSLPQDLSTLNINTPPSPPATDDESDGDWITPSNLNEHVAADAGLPADSRTAQQEQIDVATMTIDFAMQNVLLQMNLHLLSTNMQRIRKLTSKVLRCHACFLTVKDTSKQFCPRCGGSTLKRVNCSTNSKGEFRLHLSKNFQFNKRGDKYAIPKPIAGTANGKWSGQGGGQGGWGRDLILAEDQKEYVKQVEQDKRAKGARDLMDDDYLPGILTGDRSGRAGGRVKVGAGKNVNSKKRHA
jgi:RNA-binding protein NOB1